MRTATSPPRKPRCSDGHEALDATDRPARTSSPTRTGLLIIGASQSGVQLAVSLRALGFDEHITLLGDEDHRPYQRPALSKEFLQGTVESESLIFRSNEYWAEHNVDLVKGEYIVRIDKEPDGSGRRACLVRSAVPVQAAGPHGRRPGPQAGARGRST